LLTIRVEIHAFLFYTVLHAIFIRTLILLYLSHSLFESIILQTIYVKLSIVSYNFLTECLLNFSNF